MELTEKERARERQKRKESKKRERERERERERKREREKERERLREEREREKERERLREEREREKERERKEFSYSFEHFQGKKVVFTSLCSSPFLSPCDGREQQDGVGPAGGTRRLARCRGAGRFQRRGRGGDGCQGRAPGGVEQDSVFFLWVI